MAERRCGAGRRFAHQQHHRHHGRQNHRHRPETVVERQQCRLLLHRGVDLSLGLPQRVDGAGGIAEIGLLKRADGRLVGGAERRCMRNQHILVILFATRDQRRHRRDAKAAADISHHVDDRRGVVALRRRHAGQGSRIDRDKQQRQRRRLVNPRPSDRGVVDRAIKPGHRIERQCSSSKADSEQQARIDLGDQHAHHRHHQHDREAAGRHHQPGVGRGVAEFGLHKERQ